MLLNIFDGHRGTLKTTDLKNLRHVTLLFIGQSPSPRAVHAFPLQFQHRAFLPSLVPAPGILQHTLHQAFLSSPVSALAIPSPVPTSTNHSVPASSSLSPVPRQTFFTSFLESRAASTSPTNRLIDRQAGRMDDWLHAY